MARWLKLGVLFVVALAGAQLLLRPRLTSMPVDGNAPPLTLRDLQGATVDLGDLRGRVVLVNFWATWCPPCMAEIPELAALWREQKDQCFDLLGVAEQSPRDEVLAMSQKMPYRVLADPGGDAAAAWKVMGFPSSFLVDPSGKVVRVFQGAVTREDVRAAIGALRPGECKRI